jgi:hypothetical protein
MLGAFKWSASFSGFFFLRKVPKYQLSRGMAWSWLQLGLSAGTKLQNNVINLIWSLQG